MMLSGSCFTENLFESILFGILYSLDRDRLHPFGQFIEVAVKIDISERWICSCGGIPGLKG